MLYQFYKIIELAEKSHGNKIEFLSGLLYKDSVLCIVDDIIAIGTTTKSIYKTIKESTLGFNEIKYILIDSFLFNEEERRKQFLSKGITAQIITLPKSLEQELI